MASQSSHVRRAQPSIVTLNRNNTPVPTAGSPLHTPRQHTRLPSPTLLPSNPSNSLSATQHSNPSIIKSASQTHFGLGLSHVVALTQRLRLRLRLRLRFTKPRRVRGKREALHLSAPADADPFMLLFSLSLSVLFIYLNLLCFAFLLSCFLAFLLARFACSARLVLT